VLLQSAWCCRSFDWRSEPLVFHACMMAAWPSRTLPSLG
jgi:hypothetical protein